VGYGLRWVTAAADSFACTWAVQRCSSGGIARERLDRGGFRRH